MSLLRKELMNKEVGTRHGFRMRGVEIARIESFSDAVFAFAVTLLVVSLEVPKTFSELLEIMKGFPAFALGFALLVRIWYLHYIFFRRYGLQDGGTITYTSILLFVVVFFVYPLKFLFSFLVKGFSGQQLSVRLQDGALEPMLVQGQIVPLMTIYGCGYIAIFGILALLYAHAFRRRKELGLTLLEEFDTRYSIKEHMLNVGIGAISVFIILAFGESHAALSGLTYMFVGPVIAIHGSFSGKQRRKLESQLKP